MRGLTEQATSLAIELDHPAYDCLYLALAHQRKWRFVTADERLLGVVGQKGSEHLTGLCVSLDQIDRDAR